MELKNKVAIVLGGIKGIGKDICINLLESGVKVVATWFDWEEELASMKDDFSKTGTEYLIKNINLLETKNIPKLVEDVIDKFGKLNILINNIERGGWPILHGKYVEDQWDLEIETTLRAKQWIFENAIPYLKASKSGCVINFSSIAGIVGRSGPTSFLFNEGYSAANRGISLLTETWARLGAPEVRVNEIMLGIFETRHGPGTRGWALLNDDHKKNIFDHTLVNRIGKTDDIIKCVNFLLKDAPFMTGNVIRLDGGYILGGDKIAALPKGVL
jgi:3-oxoacyl-[acyl-carrier protein] reductase